MQIVSENWKNAHEQTLLNESFVEVSLDITDPDALADASPTDNGAIYISNSGELIGGVDSPPSPYCTLEQNLWCLDGNRRALQPRATVGNGYVSDVLSDGTCLFSGRQPIITFNFDEIHTKIIPGVTITWSNTYGECADTFEVLAYCDDTLLASKEIVGNRSLKNIVFVDMADYNRIDVVIKKWCLPYRRARVEKVFIGLNKVFGKADLFGYSHKQSVDPLSTSLPKTEIQFSISNADGEYNPYNLEGLAKYITERQEVKTRYGLKMDDGSVEWIQGGTFYLSEWYAKQNGLTADFTARDMLEFMSATYYDTREIITQRSLSYLATVILRAANLPLNDDGTERWQIDESLESIYTTAQLPEDTLANCLQLIANAGECVLYQDREGILHIEPLKFEESDYKIDSFNSYSRPELTLSKPLKQINVKVYTYTKGDKGFESETTEVTKVIGTVGETISIDNPLVTDTDRANSLANWLAAHLGHRKTLDVSWRGDVSLDALDIVSNENDYNSNRVRMTDVEFKYNGAFRATGKGKVISDG